MKKLTIGLIQFKETEDICWQALIMLDNQINFNYDELEVIIVNDCSQVLLSDEFLNSFRNIKPIYIKRDKNGGPGLSRQTVIDNANGEYITFIDIDDSWCNSCVLSFFDTVIYPEKMDIIQTPFFASAQHPQTKQWLYSVTPPNLTWMFGIFWRRQFLLDNKIRHSEELRVHEDSYFIRTAVAYTDKIKQYEFMFYLWTQRNDSITRNNDMAYAYNSYATYIRAVDLVCENLQIRRPQKLMETVIQQIIYSYFVMSNPEWDKEGAKKYIPQTEKMLSFFYNRWKVFWDNADESIKQLYFKQTFNNAAHRFPKESFCNWFERIKNINQTTIPSYTQPI